MADATAGNPLAYRHAVVLYSAESTFGTAVAPATHCGLAGVRLGKPSNNAHYWGPGSASFLAAKGGHTLSEVALRWPAIVTGAKTLLTKAFRASGVLPSITLGLGYQDDVIPTKSADQIAGFKVGAYEFSLDASGGHGPLSGSITGVGYPPTTVTNLTQALSSTAPWSTYEGVFTRAAGSYPIRSWNVAGNHNLRPDYRIPGSTPASNIRSHFYLTEQAEVITGRISRYEALGVSVHANTIEQFAMVLVLTSLTDSATLTFTFADVDFDIEEKEEDENGIFWSANYQAKTCVLS